MRLRILRTCLDEPVTNARLAERLGRVPASVLHHVRTLVATGFLRAQPAEQGPRGSRPLPSRATRRSWLLDEPGSGPAMVEAFTRTVGVAASGAGATVTRLGLRGPGGERDR